MTSTDAFQKLLDDIAKHGSRLVCAVVHLNDTYLIDEQESRRLPGFAASSPPSKHSASTFSGLQARTDSSSCIAETFWGPPGWVTQIRARR